MPRITIQITFNQEHHDYTDVPIYLRVTCSASHWALKKLESEQSNGGWSEKEETNRL